MARRTRKAGIVGRFGPRYGVRIRRRVQEIEEGLKGRHTCPRCAAISVCRKSTGVWACRRCGYVFAGGGPGPPLRPEPGRAVPKARVAMRSAPGRLPLTIDADDTGALRAAVNSYLRWADVAARVRHEVKA